MRVNIHEYAFDRPFALTEVVTDRDRLSELLGLDAASDFDVKVEGVLDDEGLIIKISVKGSCYSRCDRCGELTEEICKCSFNEQLSEAEPEFDQESECYVLDDLIRECIILSAPRTSLCDPDCKGLCPVCGCNLNKQKCNCNDSRPELSNPFGVLQDIILTGGAKNGSTKK